jgi:formate/nitrite transporter FocA (FNT family)
MAEQAATLDEVGESPAKRGLDSGKHQSVGDVYTPLVEKGQGQLERPLFDLVLSGFIAGLDIGFGPLAMAVVAGRLHETFGLGIKSALFLGSFLYPLGFVFVIMGKSELFTENTLAPVAALLRGGGTITKLVRSWTVILLTNVVGTIAFSLLIAHIDAIFVPYKAVYRAMGTPLVSESFLQVVLTAILGGWLVALIAWLIESTKGSTVHFVVIYVIAYLLVGLTLFHSIIGSIEVLMGMFAGAPITWGSWITRFLIPAVIGNAVGGVFFVTALKGFQARLGERA